MSSYKIKKRQFERAKKLGVVIRPSSDSTKKIDVFEKPRFVGKGKDRKQVGGVRLASIGGFYQDGTPMGDYATYLQKPKMPISGLAVDPEQQRKNYLARHGLEPKEKIGKDGKKKKTPSYWADQILWS